MDRQGLAAVTDTGRIQMPPFPSPPAAPGGHQLPEWTHGPALSRHRLSAVCRVLGQNLHLHSGERLFCPPGGPRTLPLRGGGLDAAPSLNTFWVPGGLSRRRRETPSWQAPSWSLLCATASSPASSSSTGTQRPPPGRKSSRAELAPGRGLGLFQSSPQPRGRSHPDQPAGGTSPRSSFLCGPDSLEPGF